MAFGAACAVTPSFAGSQNQAPPSQVPPATKVYGYVLNPTGQTKPAFYSFSLTSPEMEFQFLPSQTNNGEGGGAMTPYGLLVMAKPTSFTSYLSGNFYTTDPWAYNKAISGKDSGTNSSEPFFSNDVTWDPVNNVLYGCYKKPGSSYNEIAYMDVSTSSFKRTSVGGSYSGTRCSTV